MTINIYWASIEEEWQRAEEPESVTKIFYKKGIHETQNENLNVNMCPGFNTNLKNLFALKSIYDYNFKIEDNQVRSTMYDQTFFNNHINIRSIEKRAFSLMDQRVFFTDYDSLDLTLYEYPFLEDNNITKNCLLIPGKFDIGRWFRPSEFPFILKKDAEEFKIERGEIYSYIRFHTEKQIIFKQFYFTEQLRTYMWDCVKMNRHCGPFSSLPNFYKNFKLKPLILKEIKANLLS